MNFYFAFDEIHGRGQSRRGYENCTRGDGRLQDQVRGTIIEQDNGDGQTVSGHCFFRITTHAACIGSLEELWT